MSPFQPVLFSCIAICLVYYTTAAPIEIHKCGSIFDGLTEGKFDMDEQLSSSSLGANWVGFGQNVLSYDWAIFSDSSSLKKQELSKCLTQLRTIPDIQSWTFVGKQKSAINNDLELQADKIYYTAVRVTLKNGEHIFLVSDGVQILKSQPLAKSTASTVLPEQKLSSRTILSDSECTIETEDCKSVVEILNELYGKPNFREPNPDFLVRRDDDDDDDDDSGVGSDGIIAALFGVALILLLLFLLCCILCCCLLCLLACLKGKNLSLPERKPKEDKNSSNDPLDFNEDPQDAKSYGQRDEIDAGDVATATVVEFPDTNIRRLSISHKDEAPEQDDAPSRRPGRTPGIMTSASSSFRDYRSTLNH